MAFLQSEPNSSNYTVIWQWIASGLLAVLGWVYGRKDSDKGYDKDRDKIAWRLEQLEKRVDKLSDRENESYERE